MVSRFCVEVALMESVSIIKSPWIRFLHIAALNSFAVAQPVLDRLGDNPAYLRLEGYSGIAIITSLLFFLLAAPLLAGSAMLILNWLKRHRISSILFATTATLLFAITINMILRWLQWQFDLRDLGVPDFLLAALSLPIAIAGAWLYRRYEWPGQLLSVAAVGIVLFPASFISKPAMQAEVLGLAPKKFVGSKAEKPVPIVLVAFDGLCAMSLLNEQHEIDEIRYPAFAKLAKRSNFYRNATSVHCRTTQALPAILTGQLPSSASYSPVESQHPQNLFRLLLESGQFEMTVFEPLTRLCPQEIRVLDKKLSFGEQVTELTSMLARVFLVTTLPDDINFVDMQIPRVWFGLVPDGPGLQVPSKGLIIYGWDVEHDMQIRHFAETIVKSETPGFHFLHLVVPHDPWSHLPSGKMYLHDPGISEPTAGSFGDLGELWGPDELMVQLGWQRYLLQLQYTDQCLGKILDRLEETDEFDRSLVIVVSDHGMAFVPGQERRIPTNTTVADLMSVPLFIKLPNQKIGKTSDMNVETIDVLPTIADIIKLPLADSVDGESLIAPDYHERPRKTMYFKGDQTIVVDPDFTQRFEYVDRMTSLFGTGENDDRMWNLNVVPELVGKEVASCNVGPPSVWRHQLKRGGDSRGPVGSNFIPSYFLGGLNGPLITTPVKIAVAVDGRIAATTRTSINPTTSRQWTALVPEEFFASASCKVQLFEIEQLNGSYTLREMFADTAM